ncbi:MAG: CHAT domain-containing protein, partial [Pseudomonadota bacterium]
ADPAEQGGDFVTLQELFDSGFEAELVVISGCDTGVGEYQPGEGNLSLARGFMAQGANHVISTLWPVSDRASVEFMRLFYAALATGDDVSVALRSAQRSLSQSIDYADPFYWAPYVLTAVK